MSASVASVQQQQQQQQLHHTYEGGNSIKGVPDWNNGTTIDGEEILLRGALTPKWKWHRTCTCIAASSAYPPILVIGLAYWACGGQCREAEMKSFSFVLTRTSIHYHHKLYSCCNMCCQSTVRKTIPLDKIIDVTLVSDWCGDNCGCAEHPGAPYKLLVQTAADGGTGNAELDIVCIEDPEMIRREVLKAKARLLGAGGGGASSSSSSTGATIIRSGMGKDESHPMAVFSSSSSPSAMMPMPIVASHSSTGDTRPVVAVLERIEIALNENLRVMKTVASSSHGAGASKL